MFCHHRSWGRRAAALGVAVATGSLLTPAAASAPLVAAADPRPTPLRLVPDGAGLRAAEVGLGGSAQTVRATSFSMLGVTWRDDGMARDVRVRTRTARGWTPWRELEPLRDGPGSAGRGERSDRAGTDLQWVGRSDAVRVDVGGPRPSDLTLSLMRPDRVVSARTAAAPRTAPARGHRPALLSRAAWGADPGWRSGRPRYNRTLQQVHVHHTVNGIGNDYARRDVPGLLRGMYRYHTQSLGWSDLGYNFLVDRFGRTWVGRAGGMGRPVQGAHTLGFNSTSTGVAVIGEFESAAPGRRVIGALARLAAWKLDQYHRRPRAMVEVYSHGSDRFAEGRRVRLPTIDGHRDTNETACPGALLYAELPAVRRRAAVRMAEWRATAGRAASWVELG